LDIYDLVVALMHTAIFDSSGVDCHMLKGLVERFLYFVCKLWHSISLGTELDAVVHMQTMKHVQRVEVLLYVLFVELSLHFPAPKLKFPVPTGWKNGWTQDISWTWWGKKPVPARDQSSLILCVLFIVHYPSFFFK